MELSRDLAKTKYGVIHTSVPQLIPSYADSRIVNPVNVRSIGLSKIRALWNHGGMDNVKRSSKVGTWVLWNCPVDFSPNDSKSRGVITCLAKTNRNPKDFIWVCSIAATQIKVRVWVWICPDIASAIASQNSNNTIKNRKSFRKCYISRTAPRKVGARAPLDRKACGVITCLTKAENSKPWRPVVRPNRYGWIWIVANTVFIVFGWTTRVWNNCPLDRSNGRKTSWETNAASGVCINHHPRNCKSRGVITWSPRPPKKYFRHRPSSLSTYGYWSSNLYLLEFRHIRAYCRGQQPPIETL